MKRKLCTFVVAAFFAGTLALVAGCGKSSNNADVEPTAASKVPGAVQPTTATAPGGKTKKAGPAMPPP